MHARKIMIGLGVLVFATSAAAIATFNFGEFRDNQLDAHSQQLFGIVTPVEESSTESIDASTANGDPTRLVTLAKGLSARVVSAAANLAPNIDMMVLWPPTNPTHLIACNEEGAAQPALQRIRLSNGAAETILTGMISCDPVRATAWGTLITGEENGSSGWLIEFVDPLASTGVLFNRAAGTFSGGTGSSNFAVRPAVGRLSYESLALLPNGVLYYGDENRPSTGTPGGAYFKFIPATPWAGQGSINNLSQSPLTSGSIYGLRLGRRSGNTDYGQGSNTGRGVWVLVPPAANPAVGQDLRAQTAALKLTGYYRPEDAEVDFDALADGLVRFCANNTGNEGDDRNWGETICVTDGLYSNVTNVTTNPTPPEVQFLVVGTPELAMMDNLTHQPGRGNWIIHEDGDGPNVGRNNDLWSCVDDGDDDDRLSDGCVRIATINDLNAEWTGGTFDSFGNHFYVSVQHNITGHGVILDITGWR